MFTERVILLPCLRPVRFKRNVNLQPKKPLCYKLRIQDACHAKNAHHYEENKMSSIESVSHESRIFDPPAVLVSQANIAGMPAYQALCAEAEKDYTGFWGRLARENLEWH